MYELFLIIFVKYIKHKFLVRKRNVFLRCSIYAPKTYDMYTHIIIIFGGNIFLCLSPCNLNFQFFEIKTSIVPRTLNLRDLTVSSTY